MEAPIAVDDHFGIAGKLVRLVEHVRRQQRIRRKIKASEIPFWETEANDFDGAGNRT